MAITQANIPNVSDAVVEFDTASNFASATAFEDALISVDVSGGEYSTEDLGVLNGDSFTFVGQRSVHEISMTFVYTDGESADHWATLDAQIGNLVYVRYAPKGSTSGNRRFQTAGGARCTQVGMPSLSEGGRITFTATFRGLLSDETIP